MLKRVKTPFQHTTIPCGFPCCPNPVYTGNSFYILTAGALADSPYLILRSDTILPLSALNLLKQDSYFYSRIRKYIPNKFIFLDFKPAILFYQDHLPNKQFILLEKSFMPTFHNPQLIPLSNPDFIKEFMIENKPIKSQLIKTVGVFFNDLFYVLDNRYLNVQLTEPILPNLIYEVFLFTKDGLLMAQPIRLIGPIFDLLAQLNGILVKNEVQIKPINLFKLINEFNEELKNEIFDCLRNIKPITFNGLVKTSSGKFEESYKEYICNDIYSVNSDELKNNNIIKYEKNELTNQKDFYYPINDELFFSDSHLNILIQKYFNSKLIEELNNPIRIDLSDCKVFNIDPPNCTDIDDAIHVEVSDLIYIYVHIADVTALVEPDSYLDQLALERSNTYYLNYFRLEMYNITPLLSLDPLKTRLAFTAKFTFTSEYKHINTEFFKSKIKNTKSFSYDQANNLLHSKCKSRCKFNSTNCKIDSTNQVNSANGVINSPNQVNSTSQVNSTNQLNSTSQVNSTDKEYFSQLKILNKIAIKLRKERFSNGALSLSTSKSLDSNYLVEEFMLLTNQAVAEKISKVESVLRRHEGFYPDTISLIDSTLDADLNPFNRQIHNKLVVRNMKQAEYFCSLDNDSFHTGLCTYQYTHFTSPIRRYADCIVHRILFALIHNQPIKYTYQSLRNICNKINYNYRNSKLISREIELFLFYQSIDSTKVYNCALVLKNVLVVEGLDIELSVGMEDEPVRKMRVRLIKNDEKFFVRRLFEVVVVEYLSSD